MNNKKTLWIIVGLAVLAIIIIVIAVSTGSQQPSSTATKTGEDTNIQVAPTDLDKETPIAAPEEVQQAQPIIEGGSKVIDNVVITPEGKPVKTDVTPGSLEAPVRVDIPSQDVLPPETIKLTVKVGSFTPTGFEVRAGQVVTLSLASGDGLVHTMLFDDPSLRALGISANSDVAEVITFNAPTAGEYGFHCDVPGHGESGVMIVK
jgi:plastocyanin